ncbi:hypothetical protein KAW65_01690 [candidate division WOR-3 bacterium]|nr:hypothetical protein [candidate division WOR-3 bacterium]
MKRKNWIIWIAVLLIALIVILIWTPKILNAVFEKTTRIMEQQFIKKAPEYINRIEDDFSHLILAFKEGKLKKKDLEELSKLIKTANEDKKLTKSEINEILLFIENLIRLK